LRAAASPQRRPPPEVRRVRPSARARVRMRRFELPPDSGHDARAVRRSTAQLDSPPVALIRGRLEATRSRLGLCPAHWSTASIIRAGTNAAACPSAGARAPHGVARCGGTSPPDTTRRCRPSGSASRKRTARSRQPGSVSRDRSTGAAESWRSTLVTDRTVGPRRAQPHTYPPRGETESSRPSRSRLHRRQPVQ